MKNYFTRVALIVAALTSTLGFTSCGDDSDPVDPTPTTVSYLFMVTNKQYSSSEALTTLGEKLTTYFSSNLGDYATVTNISAGYNVSVDIKVKSTDVSTVNAKLAEMQNNAKELDAIITGINGINQLSLQITYSGKTVYTYTYEPTYTPSGVWVGQTAAGDSALVWVAENAESDGSYQAYAAIGETISLEGKVEGLGKSFLFCSDSLKQGSKEALLEVYMPVTADSTFEGKIDGSGYSLEKVTFTKVNTPKNMYFALSCKVCDPDNELAALGLVVENLQANMPDAQTVDLGTKTGKQIANMLLASTNYCMEVSSAMADQINAYPGLLNTNVYIEMTGAMANVASGIRTSSQKVYYKSAKSE